MITVQININGVCIMARSCSRVKDADKDGLAMYRTDCGDYVLHDPNDGAISLSKKLLDTIKE